MIVKGSGGGTTGSGQSFTLPLRIPRVITAAHPTIPVKRAAVRVFANGPKTMMWTYGGSFPGPTIRRPSGASTRVTFHDELPGATGSLSVHLHGDHHASASDGQPASDLLAPGHSRTYTYPLRDNGKAIPGAFFYYHDHRMMRTGRNNWRGLQGMFIVDNKNERKFGLPSGRYDVPLAVTDRSFTKNNQLTDPFPTDPMRSVMGSHAPPNDATVGNTVLVNGEYSPHFDVVTHRYRLRILNSSNFQAYDFRLSDGRSFTQLGSGDSLFPRPVARKHIVAGPVRTGRRRRELRRRIRQTRRAGKRHRINGGQAHAVPRRQAGARHLARAGQAADIAQAARADDPGHRQEVGDQRSGEDRRRDVLADQQQALRPERSVSSRSAEAARSGG